LYPSENERVLPRPPDAMDPRRRAAGSPGRFRGRLRIPLRTKMQFSSGGGGSDGRVCGGVVDFRTHTAFPVARRPHPPVSVRSRRALSSPPAMLRPNPRFRTSFRLPPARPAPGLWPAVRAARRSGRAALAQARLAARCRGADEGPRLDAAMAMLLQLVAAPDAPPMAFHAGRVHAARSDTPRASGAARRPAAPSAEGGSSPTTWAPLPAPGAVPPACEELDKARQNGASERDVALLYAPAWAE
jgi:hypothetical protein